MGNGMMKVSDILTRVKKTFGDESAVQVQDADIIRWINDAQREAVMQHEGLLETQGFVSSVAGTSNYDLPVNCFTLISVYYRDNPAGSYYEIPFRTRQQLDEFVDGWQGTDFAADVPQCYTRGQENQTKSQITLFPTPATSQVSGIKVIYARYATDVTSSNDDIDLPAFYYGYVEQYCLMKAYEMDEDWESADKKAAFIQSTIDFNNNRETWFGRDTYPVINTAYEDY